ncbi:hypothetical protein TNCV_1304501 [Trichonephila clavipes]|nr:hypothetical protein TNCV_1304501 [Trichonephila clavipes]
MATEITVCPFSNKHAAALMFPNIVINGVRVKCSMTTRVGPLCEGSEKTPPRTLIGQIKKHAFTSHPVTHIRPLSRNHSQQISSNREERCYTSKIPHIKNP